MVILIIISIIYLLSNVIIDVFVSETNFIVKIFSLIVINKKDEKYYKFLSKIINNSSSNNDINLNVFKQLEIQKLNITINTKINSYNTFLFSDIIINLLIENIYPYIKQYIPNFYYCYQESGQNRISINSRIKMNVFLVLLTYLKGKINVTKKYKRNVK